ncbi:MAG: LptA/OstA family protein [Mariprofundus sp.]|nr:LptA/OstA family protein [Mariprofundus sp.]
MRQKLRRYLFPLLLLCLLPLPLWAATVQIDAGKMTIYQKEGKVEFVHKVHLIRETMTLKCDHLIAYYSDHKLTHADGDGHVVISQEQLLGHSDRVHLDQIKGLIILSGQAVLEQQGSRVEGEKIVHHLNSQETTVTPTKGGRIHMTIESDQSPSSPPLTESNAAPLKQLDKIDSSTPITLEVDKP